MMKRSFLLTAAFALFASLALAPSSQAGTYVFQGTFSVGSPYTASNAILQFSDTVTGGATITSNVGTITYFPINVPMASVYEMKLVFAPHASGMIEFTVTSYGNYLGGGFDGLSNPNAPYSGSITPLGAVPEPSSMALLGIGMTSFLAFRRFFKRTPPA